MDLERVKITIIPCKTTTWTSQPIQTIKPYHHSTRTPPLSITLKNAPTTISTHSSKNCAKRKPSSKNSSTSAPNISSNSKLTVHLVRYSRTSRGWAMLWNWSRRWKSRRFQKSRNMPTWAKLSLKPSTSSIQLVATIKGSKRIWVHRKHLISSYLDWPRRSNQAREAHRRM